MDSFLGTCSSSDGLSFQIHLSKLIQNQEGRIAPDERKKEFLTSSLTGNIRHIGFTLTDFLTGPFSLELDYIALLRNKNHKEHYPYESYRVPIHYRY